MSQYAEKLRAASKFDESMGPELARVLEGRVMLSALRELLLEADARQSQLATIALHSDEGRFEAIRIQGVLQGIHRTIDALMTMAGVE